MENTPTRIVADFFPARLLLAAPQIFESTFDMALPEEREPKRIPEGTYYVDVCRIVFTQNEIVIAVEEEDGVRIIFRDKYSPIHNVSQDIDRIITTTGRMLVFEVDSTCGCGARLKSWNPSSAPCPHWLHLIFTFRTGLNPARYICFPKQSEQNRILSPRRRIMRHPDSDCQQRLAGYARSARNPEGERSL